MTYTTESVETHQHDYERFVDKAKVSAAIVSTIRTFAEAADYAVSLCRDKQLRRYAISEAAVETANLSKIVAAPCLSAGEFELLAGRCEASGISCIKDGLRDNLSGIDVGFGYADTGLAETGTLVLNCPDEELRLATMICEYHVCLLAKSKIVKDGYAAEEQLRRFMLEAPNYTAFITGPSRTADIERVLSIGVHGPLELHILILEDE